MIKLPKVKDLRFGQLLYNALIDAYIWERDVDILNPEPKIIQHRDIFYMTDEKLEQIINKFLEKYGQSTKH